MRRDLDGKKAMMLLSCCMLEVNPRWRGAAYLRDNPGLPQQQTCGLKFGSIIERIAAISTGNKPRLLRESGMGCAYQVFYFFKTEIEVNATPKRQL